MRLIVADSKSELENPMKLLIIPILLLLGACANLAEDQLFEHEYALHEAREAYMRKSAACQSYMIIVRRGSRIYREPSKTAYQTARCAT